MDINKVLEGLDELFAEAKMQEVIPYLTDACRKAEQEGDAGSMLSILNELIGFCRESCQYEESMAYAKDAVLLIEKAGFTGTIHHATTLLNIANALRAAGHLEDSLSTYQQTGQMYEQLLSPDDFGFANLNNNMSLLYQEMGDFQAAADCLKKALSIVEKYPGKEWELAVTYTNLANTYLQLVQGGENSGQLQEEAVVYAKKAVALFEKMKVRDTHYAAAKTAMGQIFEEKMQYQQAAECYQEAMEAIRTTLGKTDYYERVKEYWNRAVGKTEKTENCSGRSLCRAFYEEYGAPMLEEKYASYRSEITVGLVGEGSDCFGFDDEISRDHDWGPGFCLWLPDALYKEIGEALQQDYEQLPREYKGYKRISSKQGQKRLGVHSTREFYEYFIGEKAYEQWKQTGSIQGDVMLSIPEYRLAAATNGEVFQEANGEFTRLRSYLLNYYATPQQLQKLAQACALFSQNAQYNYGRMKKRGDKVSALCALTKGMQQALFITYVLNHTYAPHDKWLLRGAQDFSVAGDVAERLKSIAEDPFASDVEQKIEELAATLLEAMVSLHYIGNPQYFVVEEESIADTYLEHYAVELAIRADFAKDSKEELVERIVQMEWNAFDKVINEGGRAGCQDDWDTFSIMRRSQYCTWTQEMLLQYAVEFQLSIHRGWNPIMEKYGRMEQSTAPEEWEKIKAQFPVIPEQKQAIMEEIIRIQVGWMEGFAAEYPGMAQNARRIHTSEDKPWDTSYETYLRGEMGTYSDRMLELYGRFIVELVQQGRNLAYEIMEQTVRQYGYNSLSEAAQKMKA